MGSYFDPDGLYRQYGIRKATPDTAGEFKAYGDQRIVEVGIDLTKINRKLGGSLGIDTSAGDTPIAGVTATDYIQSNQVFFPVQSQSTSNAPQIVGVEVDVLVVPTTLTTWSVGLISDVDRTTVLANGGFLNLVTPAMITTLGRYYFNVPATGGGTWIGSTPVAISGPFTTPFVGAGLISARFVGTAPAAGNVRVKIFYNMQGTID